MTSPASNVTLDLKEFDGGRSLMSGAGLLGALLTAVSIGGIFLDRRPALFSYLVAFTYWVGIAFGALILVMLFHAFRAKWPVILRRPVEAMATTLPLFLILFLPLLVDLGAVYSWVHPDHSKLTHHEAHLMHMKEPYLNVPFFVVRTIVYLLLASVIAYRLHGLSLRQDVSGDPRLTQKARNLGTGGLPLIGIITTFAAVDWLMTLNPLWFSTIFGVYVFAGSFWTTLAILIIAIARGGGRNYFGTYVSVEVLHNIGKLFFAFTCFWGYVAFSQLMLIWIANLPEETPFFIVRMQMDGVLSWGTVGILLIALHFVVPFALLLSRDLKRNPRKLSAVAALAVIMNFVDIYWLVIPTLSPDRPTFHWTLITSWIGLGALGLAFAVWRLRGRYSVPVKDPFLPVSLRYRQPT